MPVTEKTVANRTVQILIGTVAVFMLSTTLAASPTLDKIKKRKEIALGYRESSVPFSYLDLQYKPVGFSMDLCSKIVERVKQAVQIANLNVKYIAVNSLNRIPLIKNGAIDVECGAASSNPQRRKVVDFSLVTFINQPKWLVKKK